MPDNEQNLGKFSRRSYLAGIATALVPTLAIALTRIEVYNGSLPTPIAPPTSQPLPETPTPQLTVRPTDIKISATSTPEVSTPEPGDSEAVGSSPTPTPTPTPPDAFVYTGNSDLDFNLQHAYLFATATAVSKNHKDTTFTEQPPFTEEAFNEVRRSTFIIYSTKDNWFGTAWLARREGNIYYFVTSRHILRDEEGFWRRNFLFVRPTFDQQNSYPYYYPSKIRYEYEDTGKDVAVLKCWGKYPNDNSLAPLHYQDDYLPSNDSSYTDKKYLSIGFPAEFLPDKLSQSISLVSVADYNGDYQVPDDPLLTSIPTWVSLRWAAGGVSGSPVVKIGSDGHPLVVAITYGHTPEQEGVPSYRFAINMPLNVSKLIDRLKSIK